MEDDEDEPVLSLWFFAIVTAVFATVLCGLITVMALNDDSEPSLPTLDSYVTTTTPSTAEVG